MVLRFDDDSTERAAEEGVNLSEKNQASPEQTTQADAPDEAEPPLGSPWEDLRAFVATPRLGELTLSPDGNTLLAAVSALDVKRTSYTSALWKVDPTGQRPARRFTRSVEGEASGAFTYDGTLLFMSKRPVPPAAEEDSANDDSGDAGVIWCLPADGGEAYPLARRDGGWTGMVAARDADRVIFAAPVHAGVADEKADAKKRALRRKKKVTAILHEGYPVRSWDHDLGPECTRLLAADLTGTDAASGADLQPSTRDFRDLTGDVGRAVGDSIELSRDGTRLLVDWQQPRPRGEMSTSVASIDTATGQRRIIAADEVDDFSSAVISDDESLIACVREYTSTPEQAPDQKLWLIDGRTGEGRLLAEEWDVWAQPIAFSPDSSKLYVQLDENGHGPIYAVDVVSGEPLRLTDEGAFASVLLSPDGATLYAVRTSYADPGSIVAINTDDGTLTVLKAPVDYPELPGRLEDVETITSDGTRVRGYLLLPDGTSDRQPAPLALWIHGGPLSSWNSWSWRWCPWLLVSRGYAVLLPDPALSTGYGLDFVQRGWGRWGAEPYTDLMAITDAIEDRTDIDDSKTVAMGGSFGGYMANWVAGHTDRFAAIVSHASLWNLESFGPTTDAAWFWAREMTPAMQAENSPHRSADKINTPMLVVHGDKDYRVPISEGLALWWALVSAHDGPPEELPHKFLYFPDENHWVLSPQHAIVWYDTVLAFLQLNAGDGNFVRPEAL